MSTYTKKFKLSILEEDEPKTVSAQVFSDIVDMVRLKIGENIGCDCGEPDCTNTSALKGLHPRDIIAMSSANIIVNLFLNGSDAPDPKTHAAMFESLLNQVNDMCIESFKTFQHLQRKRKRISH